MEMPGSNPIQKSDLPKVAQEQPQKFAFLSTASCRKRSLRVAFFCGVLQVRCGSWGFQAWKVVGKTRLHSSMTSPILQCNKSGEPLRPEVRTIWSGKQRRVSRKASWCCEADGQGIFHHALGDEYVGQWSDNAAHGSLAACPLMMVTMVIPIHLPREVLRSNRTET